MAIFFNQATLSYNNNTTSSNIVSGEIMEVLSATKDSIPQTYQTGDLITYVINIFNTGQAEMNDLTLTDNLGEYAFQTTTLVPLDYVPDSLRYYNSGIQKASPAVTSVAPLTIEGIVVPAGGNTTIIYQATVNQYAPQGTDAFINNTASISGTPVTTVTASAKITANQSAALTISKSVSPEIVPENGELTYTFTIQNTGSTPLTDTDDTQLTDVFLPILSITGVTFNGTAWTADTNYTYDEQTGLFTTNPGQITVPAATYTQDPVTGSYMISPGSAVLKIQGNIQTIN